MILHPNYWQMNNPLYHRGLEPRPWLTARDFGSRVYDLVSKSYAFQNTDGVCINKNWNNSVDYMGFDDFEYDENAMPLLLVDESEHNRRFT